jgi:hypothetical protein
MLSLESTIWRRGPRPSDDRQVLGEDQLIELNLGGEQLCGLGEELFAVRLKGVE